MKQESEIAKENVKGCGKRTDLFASMDYSRNLRCGESKIITRGVRKSEEEVKVFCRGCNLKQKEHLAHCQRELEFLTGLEYDWTEESENGLINRITDLKKAIEIEGKEVGG